MHTCITHTTYITYITYTKCIAYIPYFESGCEATSMARGEFSTVNEGPSRRYSVGGRFIA